MPSLIAQKNYSYLKYLFFIIFIFPFLMHIYWGVFDIFYSNNIAYISLFLLIWLLFFNYFERDCIFFTQDKALFFSFSVFLIILSLNSYILRDLKELVKYTTYIIFYYYLFSKFSTDNYFRLYINIVTFFVFVNIFLYFLCLFTGLQSYFVADTLSLIPSDSSFISRQDWEYAIPFYLIVFPIHDFVDGQTNLLGLPRLFGMSTEPSLYSVVVLPTMIMALFFKNYFKSLILFLGLFLASSYGVFLIGLIGMLFYMFYKYKIFLFFIFVILFFLAYFLGVYEQLMHYSPRLNIYMGMILNIFNLSSITLFANHNFDNADKLQVLSALLSQTLKYGLLQGMSYLMIFFIYIKLSLKTNNKLIFVFAIVSLLIVNKSGEILSPLFLFYLRFVYSQYLTLNNTLKR